MLPGWVPPPSPNRDFYKSLLQGLNDMFSLALAWGSVLTAETLAKHWPQFFIFLSVECGLVLRTDGGYFSLHNYFCSEVYLERQYSLYGSPGQGACQKKPPTLAAKTSLGVPTLHVHSVEKDSVVFDTKLSFRHMRSHMHACTHTHNHTCACTKREWERYRKGGCSISDFFQIFILFFAELTCWFP